VRFLLLLRYGFDGLRHQGKLMRYRAGKAKIDGTLAFPINKQGIAGWALAGRSPRSGVTHGSGAVFSSLFPVN
jgi:hypothetical protein